MIVLYIILGFLALVLTIGLFISRDLNYRKSIVIEADIQKVWENVNSLSAMDSWSPWNQRDPNMEKTFSGTDGKPGATQSWKSPVKNVGEGSQTIQKLDPPNRIDVKLNFIKPFKSTADSYVTLEKSNGGTKATWGFESSMHYPMNIMKVFMNFEKSMGKDFGEGLEKLKSISEKNK
jgi:uncharacterized protein YndB with AHSA1/START domain